MIDNQGKIKGRISLVDLLIVAAILALVAGVLYRQVPTIQNVINPDTPLYVTIQGDGLRDFITDAVDIGDPMFRLHDRQPLGEVVRIERVPAQGFFHHADGTATLADMEGRYTINITLRGMATVRDEGFFLNGSDHMSPGREVALHSNRVFIPNGRVIQVTPA